MSIDTLHDRIRRLKSPIVLELGYDVSCVPESVRAQCDSDAAAFYRYCEELLAALKDCVPAVRFDFAGFALLEDDGIRQLKVLTAKAKELGYYVIVDAPEVSTPRMAGLLSEKLLTNGDFSCDGLVISPYIGSDAVKPFQSICKNGKNIFVTVRSANKSASELQDLLSGTRHVHNASAEMAVRLGEQMYGKCGYSQIGATVAAGAPEYLKALRAKHNRLFFLVDGLDLPSGNSKYCSYAFDRFGYGAAVSVNSIVSAWKDGEGGEGGYLSRAMDEVERVKKNLSHYVAIL